MPFFAAALLGYLLGSIPFGVLVTRLGGAGDLRKIGSGNIGTTNVLRTGRKDLAAVTLIGDMLKATVAVLIASHFWGAHAGLAAGAASFIGHVYPVWLRFKGGKGVATYIGVLVALAWPAALAFGVVWIAVAAATRYSSAAALAASLATPFAIFFWGDVKATELFALLTILLWLRHRENIARLLNGTEGKIGAGKIGARTPG